MSDYITDRIAGVILFVFAVIYTWHGSTLEANIASDPLGPGAFPTILGILFGICSIAMILKPDVNPKWPGGKSWLLMTIIIASLVIYALIMRPIGFVIATALEMITLGLVFKGPPLKLIGASVFTTLFLYFLFDVGLGLNLPKGILPF